MQSVTSAKKGYINYNDSTYAYVLIRMSLAPQHTRIVEISWLSLVAIVLTSLIACQPKKIQENSHFPPSVQITFTNKCATAGCHNEKSYRNAGGLNLSSWEALFAGGNNGSVVVNCT